MSQIIEPNMAFDGKIQSFTFYRGYCLELSQMISVYVKLELDDLNFDKFKRNIHSESSRIISGKCEIHYLELSSLKRIILLSLGVFRVTFKDGKLALMVKQQDSTGDTEIAGPDNLERIIALLNEKKPLTFSVISVKTNQQSQGQTNNTGVLFEIQALPNVEVIPVQLNHQ